VGVASATGPRHLTPDPLPRGAEQRTRRGRRTCAACSGPVRDVDDAIAWANATPYGLNASVWIRNGARGRAVAARVHAGTVNVNVNEAFAAAWGSIDAPMGGMDDSGIGRRHGSDGILTYTEPRTAAHQRLVGFTPPARMSPETWAALLTGAQKVLEAAGAR
jgi:succinate-semialdehyde dehydrogenase/glutarate-semialdehyde dehydrogenase